MLSGLAGMAHLHAYGILRLKAVQNASGEADGGEAAQPRQRNSMDGIDEQVLPTRAPPHAMRRQRNEQFDREWSDVKRRISADMEKEKAI